MSWRYGVLTPSEQTVWDRDGRVSQMLDGYLAVGSWRHAAERFSGFEVLYLKQTAPPPSVGWKHVPLIDDAGNDPRQIAEALAWGLSRLRLGKQLFVCCEHGANRSPAICAGLLFLRGDFLSLGEAMHAIAAVRRRVDVMPPRTLADVAKALGVES